MRPKVLLLFFGLYEIKGVVVDVKAVLAIKGKGLFSRVVNSYLVVVDFYVLLSYGDACVCIAFVEGNTEYRIGDGLTLGVVSCDDLVVVDLNVFNEREHHNVVSADNVYLVISEYSVLNRRGNVGELILPCYGESLKEDQRANFILINHSLHFIFIYQIVKNKATSAYLIKT